MAAVAAGAAVHQGEQARAAGNRSARAAKAAQRQSLLASATREKQAAADERRLNPRKPDVTSILFDEQRAGNTGPASTILAGKGGGKSLLGTKSTLGY